MHLFLHKLRGLCEWQTNITETVRTTLSSSFQKYIQHIYAVCILVATVKNVRKSGKCTLQASNIYIYILGPSVRWSCLKIQLNCFLSRFCDFLYDLQHYLLLSLLLSAQLLYNSLCPFVLSIHDSLSFATYGCCPSYLFFTVYFVICTLKQ